MTTFTRNAKTATGVSFGRPTAPPGGTELLKDIRPGDAGSYPGGFTEFQGRLYFTADDGGNGTELWVTNGTANGTQLVKDINPGAASSSPANLTVSGGRLFFAATTASNGNELWTSDGSAERTVMVKDLYSGSGSSWPSQLTDVNGTLFFAADDAVWRSDGTSLGTTLVREPRPGTASSELAGFTALGNRLIFSANGGSQGSEIWSSDGTWGGTWVLKDLRSGSRGSAPSGFTECNGFVYFSANDGTSGSELWRTDGTYFGTQLVRDIFPGEKGSVPQYLANVAGRLYFRANDGTTGVELWTSDGSAAGTALVRDILPGGKSSNPQQFTALDGHLIFTANDGSSGTALWRSQGTADTTFGVGVIVPAGSPGFPGHPTAADGKVYLSLSDGATGDEPWVVSVVEQGPTIAALIDSPDPVSRGDGLTLSATGVEAVPGRTVVAVRFYRESNGTTGLQNGPGGDTFAGTDSNPADGWSTSVDSGLLRPGSYTFYAQAIDDQYATSPDDAAAVSASAFVQVPLQVTSTLPALDQGPIAETSTIDVTFSEPIDPATLDVRDVGLLDLSNPVVSRLSQYALSGEVFDVALQANLLYAVTSTGLEILDISDPTAPTLRGRYATPGLAEGGVELVGNIAYFVNGGDGLVIVDVSDPATPRWLGTCTAPSQPYNVKVRGGLAYVADFGGMLEIINVSDPTTPVCVGQYTASQGVLDVEVVGHLAYLAEWNQQLEIVDVSDPTSPAAVGSCPLPGSALDLQVIGDRAYVAAYIGGFQVVDVSDPASPLLLGGYATTGWAFGVEVVGNLAYVVNDVAGRGGLEILDISELDSIRRLGGFDTSGHALAGHVSGSVAYVVDADSGVEILQVGRPATAITHLADNTYRIDFGQRLQRHDYGLQLGPEIEDPPGKALDQDGDGTHRERGVDAYFARFTVAHLPPTIGRLTNSANPVAPGEPLTLTAKAVVDPNPTGAVVRVRFYRETNGTAGLQTGTTGDTLVGVDSSPSGGWSVKLSTSGLAAGSYIYYALATDDEGATSAGGIEAASVTNLVHVPLQVIATSPNLAAGPSGPISSIDVTFNEPVDLATLSRYDVALIDMDDVEITLLGQYSGSFVDCVVQGSLLYAATLEGLRIFDASDPAALRLVGACALGSTRRLSVVNNYVYVTGYELGLQIVDVSDPSSPLPVGRFGVSSSFAAVAVAGEVAYVTDSEQGLQILDVSDPTAPTKVGSFAAATSALDLVADGSLLYLGSNVLGFHILDVSNPAAPAPLAYINAPAPYLDKAGGWAYLGNGVVDVSAPAAAQWSGYLLFTPGVNRLRVAGSLAYAMVSGWGFSLLDISDPLHSVTLQTYDTRLDSYQIAVAGGVVYLADGSCGLTVLQVGQVATSITHVSGNTYRIGLDRSLQGQRYVLQIGSQVVDATGIGLDQDCDGIGGERGEDVYSVHFVVSNTAPTVLGLGDSPDPVLAGQPIVLTAVGVADPDPTGTVVRADFYRESNGTAGLQLGVGGDTLVGSDLDPNGGWSTAASTADLSPGRYTYYVQATDNLGAVSVDATAAASAVNLVREPLRVIATTPVLDGKVEPLSSIEVTFNQPIDTNSFEPSDVALLDLANVHIAELTELDGFYYEFDVDGSRLYAAAMNELQVFDVTDPTVPVRLGGYAVSGTPNRVQAIGDRVYLVDSDSGLEIVDLSNPAEPVLLGSYKTSGAITVEVVGDLAYLGIYGAGLEILDLSDPTSPVRLGDYSMDYTYDVQLVGSLAYIANGYAGLTILDVSDPADVKLLGRDGTHARCVEVVGNLAYLSGDAISVIDVSNPSALKVVGHYQTSTNYNFRDLDVVANLVYATENDVLEILDVSDPAAIENVATWSTYAGYIGVEVVGNVAYSLRWMDRLQVLQVGQPATAVTHVSGNTYRVEFGRTLSAGRYAIAIGPEIVDLSGRPMGQDQFLLSQEGSQALFSAHFTVEANGPPVIASLKAGSNAIYVGQNLTVLALGVSDPGPSGSVLRVGFYRESNGTDGLQTGVGGDTLIGIDQDPTGGWSVKVSTTGLGAGIYTYYAQATDTEAQQSPSGTAAPRTTSAIEIRPDALCVTAISLPWVQGVAEPFASFEVTFSGPIDEDTFGPSDVAVLDLSRLKMSLTSQYSGTFYDCVVHGSLLYAATSDGFQILDISNPATPILRSLYVGAAGAQRVKVVGSIAYISGGGLLMLDVSNPDSPVYLGGNASGGHVSGIDVVGSLVFTQGSYGLQILDVTDPLAPVQVGVYGDGGSMYLRDVQVVRNLAYLANDGGLEVVDISNPASPSPVGRCDLGGSAASLQVSGDRVYVADYVSGFCIVDVSNPAVPLLLGRYHTPGWASAVEVAGHLAFVSAGTLLHVLDISDPAHITQVAEYFAGYETHVSLAGDRLYVAAATGGLRNIKLGQAPTSIVPVSDTTYRVDFGQPLPQGDYVLLVGPEIRNSSGTLIDQGGDGVDRERWNDAYFARVDVSPPSLDADADGVADALTDGILILRYLFHPAGGWTFNDALSTDATRVSREKIRSFLDFEQLTVLDVDGNGTADALTDGILVLRYLFSPSGDWDFRDAVGWGATRTTREQIRTFLDQYNPSLAADARLESDLSQRSATQQAPTPVAEVELSYSPVTASAPRFSPSAEQSPAADEVRNISMPTPIVPPTAAPAETLFTLSATTTTSAGDEQAAVQQPAIDPRTLGLVFAHWNQSRSKSELTDRGIFDECRPAEDGADALDGVLSQDFWHTLLL
jgi:ELWxxDGT repeat protein